MGNVFENMSPVTDEETARTLFKGAEQYNLACLFAPLCSDLLLLGVFLMQVNTYFTYQNNDSKITQWAVLLTLVLTVAVTIYIIFMVQEIFVENFGKFAILFKTGTIGWAPCLDALSSCVVQTFMGYRAYLVLGRGKAIFIPIVVGVLCVISLVGALSSLIVYSRLNSLIDAKRVEWSHMLWLASIMCADVIITTSIIYGLTRSKTGWTHTDKTIGKLIRMTIESQIPPLLIAVVFVVEFTLLPSNLLGATLQNIQQKFYAVGMMYSINARLQFKRAVNTDMDHNGNQTFGMDSRNHPTQIQVNVETETYTTRPYGMGQRSIKGDDEYASLEDTLNNEYGSQARLAPILHKT